MTTTRRLLIGLTGLLSLAALLLVTAGCGGQSTSNDAPAGQSAATHASAGGGPSKVLFLGDSVAAGQALPLAAAFKASGAGFESIAENGGGNVVGPFSDKNWKKLGQQIASADPTVVVYQLTTYDWGSRDQQQAAYDRLLRTVTRADAKLVFVTSPPIKPDDFYKPHMPDLDRAPDVARAVAEQSDGQARLLDASAVWGSTYQQVRDGKPDRSTDGIHTCPQGAARFARWLLSELATLLPDLTPAPPDSWANTGWSADARFKGC